MQFLDDLIHKTVKPHFEKGGKLEKFFYAFEAAESFHFVTDKRTDRGAHVRDYVDLKRMMVTVVLALLPCFFFGIYNTGYQQLVYNGQEVDHVEALIQGALKVLPLTLVVYSTGGIIEAIFAVVRKHEINEGFLVSGMLITLVLPPTLPLWQAAVGTAFGVLIGKEVFGGTGMNILNPALTARAFLFFAYPAQMSGDKVWVSPDQSIVYNGLQGLSEGVQAVTQATPLGLAANSSISVDSQYSFMEMFIGLIPGSIGETSVIACALGAGLLIMTGVGSWKTMVSCILGAVTFILAFKATKWGQEPTHILGEGFNHLVMGSFAFAIVFMATDPVSSAQTEKGKWIYGFGIGIMGMLIRCLNPAYPEGWMLAILFMNVFAPLIDHYVVKANIKRRLARA